MVISMINKVVLSRNYYIDPEAVTELGAEVYNMMAEADQAMAEASEIIAEIASLTERVPSQIRCGALLEACAAAQEEIKNVDFLSYGYKVNQGLLNLLDHNQYITEHFIKNMEMNTEKMRGLGGEFRRLADSITCSGESAQPKGIASSAVKSEDTDDTEDNIPAREELIRQAAAKMAGITLNENGSICAHSYEEVIKIQNFNRYLDELRRGEYSYVQMAAVLAGVANSNMQPIINDPISSMNYSNYFSLFKSITYTDSIVEYIKQSESLVLELYNNGQTIGYGFDVVSHKNIDIIFQTNGTITEKEAERLLCIVLDENAQLLNNFWKIMVMKLLKIHMMQL